MQYVKKLILELITNAVDGLTVADIAEAVKRKYTTAGQLLLNYTRQGLLNRQKQGTAQYVYKISNRGKERLEYLMKNQA